jgi:hypothetical protein
LRFDKLADLFNGVGRVQTFRTVFEIARPVCQFRLWQAGEEWGDDGTSHHRREDFDEVSLVHSQELKRRIAPVEPPVLVRITATILHLFLFPG